MLDVMSLSDFSKAENIPVPYKIGDIITFPKHIDDIRCRGMLISNGQINLIEVKKNGNYWLFPIHYIRQIDINRQPIHPVSKELLPCKNDYERILAL